jgi:hypothetical protein
MNTTQDIERHDNREAYLLPDFCGQGDRIIVHPRGLPPGWRESNISPEKQAAAKLACRYSPERRDASHAVYHLDAETLEVIQKFTIK